LVSPVNSHFTNCSTFINHPVFNIKFSNYHDLLTAPWTYYLMRFTILWQGSVLGLMLSCVFWHDAIIFYDSLEKSTACVEGFDRCAVNVKNSVNSFQS
jgi:uncharacterized membrane protein YagU involved in acid resistance